MSPHPVVQETRDRHRERILDAFAERAAQNGPRGVVMAELARDLGISTRTLYQHFSSKADIVQEIMERWASELEAEQRTRLTRGISAKERIIDATLTWIDRQDRFSPDFWSQLHRDFPESGRVLTDQVRKSLAIVREGLSRQIAPGLHPELAMSLLRQGIAHALDPRRCDRLGVSRQEAARQAIDVWCRGALVPDSNPA